jgi:hypothetical protein
MVASMFGLGQCGVRISELARKFRLFLGTKMALTRAATIFEITLSILTMAEDYASRLFKILVALYFASMFR